MQSAGTSCGMRAECGINETAPLDMREVAKVKMNGSIISMYSLECLVTYDERFSFIVLDGSIDPAVLKLIGNSFDRVNFEK